MLNKAIQETGASKEPNVEAHREVGENHGIRPFQAAGLQPVRQEDPTNNLENICSLDDTDDEDNADELEESEGTTTKEAIDR